MTTMISDLPRDLVEEILTRVPLTSMRAVRLTCKIWNALSKSPSFTTMNIGREEEAARERGESRMIVLMDNNLHLVSIVVTENPSAKLLGTLTCLNDSERIKIWKVFHCDGLLLCTLEYDHSKVVVWNPYLGHIRWIQTRYFYPAPDLFAPDRYMFTYAVGYEKKKNTSWRCHKILRFIDIGGDDWRSGYWTGGQFVRYEIYDFDSDLWTTHDVCPYWRIPKRHDGVTLKGNAYWCARKRNYHGVIEHIICFDFTSERFGPLVPLPLQAVECSDNMISLFCVREEKLAILYLQNNLKGMELQITAKIEATEVSWSKFFTFSMAYDLSVERFFFAEEKKVGIFFGKRRGKWSEIVSISGGDIYLREMNLREPTQYKFWKFVCSYVPSLVQIKKPE